MDRSPALAQGLRIPPAVMMCDESLSEAPAVNLSAATGLDFFGARYFSAAQGRFTNPDWSATPQPVPYADLSDPQSLNLYNYIRNNPLSRTDPDGHCCFLLPSRQELDYEVGFVKGYVKGVVNAYLNEEGTPAALIGSALRAAGVEPQVASNPAEAAGVAAAPYITMGLAMAVPGPGGKVGDEALAARAQEIQGGLAARTQRSVTTAVGTAVNPDGTTTTLVASSEAALRPAQKAALRPGEVPVTGEPGVHAEVKVLDAAQNNGQILTTVAPSRPACPECQQTMQQNNVRVVNPYPGPRQ